MSTTPSGTPSRRSLDQTPRQHQHTPRQQGDDRDWQQKLETLRHEDELLQGQNAVARDESEKARKLAEQTRETALKARKEALAQLAHEHELRIRAEQARDLAKQEWEQATKQVQWQKNLRVLAETALKQVEGERDTARKDRQQANLKKKAAYEAKEFVLKQLQNEESARYKLSLENEELKKALAKANHDYQADRTILAERENTVNRLNQQFAQTQQILKDTEIQRQQLLISTQGLQKELQDLKNSLGSEIQRRNQLEIELQDEKRKGYALNEQLLIELESEKARRTKAELEVQEAMNELQKVEGSRMVVEHGRHELVHKLEGESSARQQLEQERVDLNNKLRQQNEKVRLLEQACEQLHNEVQNNKENSTTSQETLHQAHQQIETLKKELQQYQQLTQQLQNENKQLNACISEIQKQSQDLTNQNQNLGNNCSSLQFQLEEMTKQRDQASDRSVELLQALLSERASRQLLQESLQDDENLGQNEMHAQYIRSALKEAVAPSDTKLLLALQNILKDAQNAQNIITNLLSEQQQVLGKIQTNESNAENLNILTDLREKSMNTTGQSTWNIQRAQEITDALIKAQPSRSVSRLSARTQGGGDIVGASASPSAPSRKPDEDDDKSSHYSSARGGRASSVDTFNSAISNFTGTYPLHTYGSLNKPHPPTSVGGKGVDQGQGQGQEQGEGDWSSPFDDPEDHQIQQVGQKQIVPALPIGDSQVPNVAVQQQQLGVPLLPTGGVAVPVSQELNPQPQLSSGPYMPPIQYGSDSHLEALINNQDKENLHGGGPQTSAHSIPRSYNDQQMSGKGTGASRN